MTGSGPCPVPPLPPEGLLQTLSACLALQPGTPANPGLAQLALPSSWWGQAGGRAAEIV